jgi:hypothetical protein
VSDDSALFTAMVEGVVVEAAAVWPDDRTLCTAKVEEVVVEVAVVVWVLSACAATAPLSRESV